MAKLVSKTYGDALFEVALESGQLDNYWEEVKAVKTAMDENQELFQLMSHPKIVKEEKIKIIEDIFAGKVSAELVGLLRMIVDKDHFEEVDSVFDYFIDKVKEFKNIGTAFVTSAMELSDAQKAAVEKRLLETTKYVKFEMHYAVDSALIGGMVIRIGDRVVDSSVRTKLYDLTRELSKIQLKAGECAP
ncbi:MAG: ATP synthase F1 subunit delta [Roseburia sp.]